MFALPILSAGIGVALGVSGVRVTGLFAVLGMLMVALVAGAAFGSVDGREAVVFGILAVVLLQLGYVLALAMRGFGRGRAHEERASGLGVSRFR